jgi:hypothetical protein
MIASANSREPLQHYTSKRHGGKQHRDPSIVALLASHIGNKPILRK